MQKFETQVDLGRWWRFIVLGDPTVRMFGVRDLDMYMLPREREAVTVWEMGNYTNKVNQFYIMRDTPSARNKAGIIMPIKDSFCENMGRCFRFLLKVLEQPIIHNIFQLHKIFRVAVGEQTIMLILILLEN